MSKLWRPSIPVEVKCRVALRQLGEMFIDDVIEANRVDMTVAPMHRRSLGKLLIEKRPALAALLDCEVSDLRLDHDPALAARPQFRRGLGKKTYYTPDANDPDHLFYRPHGTEFAGSHLIKTNTRGDHGQFPDRVLIRRERKRLNKTVKKKRSVLRSGSSWPKGRKLQGRSSWR